MDSKKFLIGTLAGGITLFLLGYLFYGMALADFFVKNSITPAGTMKSMNDIIWWALVLGNLATGALLTYIFLKLGTISSFGGGISTGAVIGFLMIVGVDLVRYSTENWLGRKGAAADVLVFTVMSAIAGGVIGMVLGMGKKKA
jgi:hypothetical protein